VSLLYYAQPGEMRLHYMQRVIKRNGVKGIDITTCALEKWVTRRLQSAAGSKCRDNFCRCDTQVSATFRNSSREIPADSSSARILDWQTSSRPVQKSTRTRNAGAGRKRKPLFLHRFLSFSFAKKCFRRCDGVFRAFVRIFLLLSF